MTARLLLIIPLLLFARSDGADEGRRGNALYTQGDYAAAARAYRAALADAQNMPPGAVQTGLWNNLGAALYRQAQHAEAEAAFRRAAQTARTPAHRARAWYNAGNNAVAQGELNAALAFYRRALRAAPRYTDARFNYEFIHRKLAERQQQRPDRRPITPSAYARQLKQRAESLAAARRYAAAFRLMQEGLRRDSTVAAFQRFIGRLSDVAQIDTTYQ